MGALVGLAAAVLAGWLIFATTTRLNVQMFFRVTSILLIFFAAGLVAHGVHELNEAGLIPAVVEHVWDTNPVLDESSGLGLILKTIFGYNGNPSLTEVIAYFGYWLVVLLALRRGRTQTKTEPVGV
jgi:high-affinity iron transporter